MATPVLVLSARSDLADKLAGFEHGADDYLTKPFALAEVEARVRALLNRSGGGSVVDPVRRFGTLEFDRERGEARVAGNVVRLTPKAAQLLELLLRQPGQLVRRARRSRTRSGPARRRSADALRSQIHWLRKALAEHGFDGIETVHGVGLRLVAREARGALMARRRSLAERVVWAVTATVALLLGLQSVLAYRDDARAGRRALRHDAAARGAADRRPHAAARPDADRHADRFDARLGLADARRRRRRPTPGADARPRARPLPVRAATARRCTSPSPTPTTAG